MADRQITNFIGNVVNNDHNNISQITVKTFNSTETFVLSRDYLPEAKPAPTPTPTPTPEPTPEPTDKPTTTFDTSKTFRLASVADVDDNSGFTTQLSLINKYNSQLYVLPGDFQYTNDNGVFNKITNANLKSKTVIADGNHDDCADIQGYVATTACNYVKIYAGGKIGVFVLDGNEPFSCTNFQLQWLKERFAANTGLTYKIVVIHEPFVTVKSDHPPNGAFSCYDPVFQSNNVDLVLQGHNHNYQVAKIGKTIYSVTGMGTHDTGSSMYDCDSSSFNSISVKCITGTNGIVIIDLGLDSKSVKGWFISNADSVKDKWLQ